MSDLDVASFKKKTASFNKLAEISGLDRRTVKSYLHLEGVESLGKDAKTGETFPVIDAIQAFINVKKGQNSADRRNDAQAEKLETETLILKRENIAISEFMEVVRPILTAISKHVERSSMEDDLKESLVKAILKEFPI